MDQTSNALFGIGKTLRDVVAPAVPSSEPLAQQELRMATRYIEFLRVRVDHLYARARHELGFHVDLADAVGTALGDAEMSTELTRERARAAELLASPGAPIDRLRETSLAIAAAVSGVVRDIADGPIRSAVERAVVSGYERFTLFERSWYLPLGMDHFGDELPPLESFLSAPAGADTMASAGV